MDIYLYFLSNIPREVLPHAVHIALTEDVWCYYFIARVKAQNYRASTRKTPCKTVSLIISLLQITIKVNKTLLKWEQKLS